MDKISSLENRLFNALPNNLAEMEKVKAAAKRELKSNDLSFPQRTHALNIILLVNEMIAASKSESESDQGLKAYYQAARVSAGKASEATDKEELTEFQESVAAVHQLAAPITNRKALELLEDIETYGMMSLTLTADLTKSISDILAENYPDIQMLDTTGDGNCFYNAISTEDYILQHNPSLEDIKNNKHEDRQAELRQTTVEEMNASHAKADEIYYHMDDKAWATDEQIRRLVVAEDKPILILTHDPVNKTKIVGTIYVKDGGAPANQDNLRVIVNIDNRHFNALHTSPETRQELINQYDSVPVA